MISVGIAARHEMPALAIIDCEHRFYDALDLGRALRTQNPDNNGRWHITKAVAAPLTGKGRGEFLSDSVRVEWIDGLSIQSDPDNESPQIPREHVMSSPRLPFLMDKRYLIDVARAVLAYCSHHGDLKNLTVNDEHRTFVGNTLAECANLLVARNGQLPNPRDGLLRAQVGMTLRETLTRVYNPRVDKYYLDSPGYGPITKLRECLLPTASYLQNLNLRSDKVMEACKMALRYQNVRGDAESVELGQKMRELPAADVVIQITELLPLPDITILQHQFLDAVREVQDERRPVVA